MNGWPAIAESVLEYMIAEIIIYSGVAFKYPDQKSALEKITKNSEG